MKTHLLASPATMHRWTARPYGVWVCADGREVLFNRYYEPIWQRIGGAVLAADVKEWVSWKRQSWFYTDTDMRRHGELCRRLEEILTTFQAGEDVTAMLLTKRAA